MVGFPLLLIPLAVFNILAFLMPTVSLTDPVITVKLMSQAQWGVTIGDALLAFGILLLWFEVIKGSRPGGKYFTDHFLALLVFAGAVAEFLLLPKFATSVFFLLTVLMLVDFLAGVSLRLRHRRRTVAPAAVAPQPVAPAQPPAPPQPQPVVLPPVAPAVVAAPDVHAERPPPMTTMEPGRPSAPAMTAPGLQPGSPSTDHH